MAFVKVSGARKYFKYSECEKGQKLVDQGTFIGSEEGKFGVQHLFKGKDGSTTVLNSAGHLNWLLDEHVNTNDLVNVYYEGKEMLLKGPMKGKEAHRFELEVDDGPRSNVDNTPVTLASATDDISL